MKKTSHLFIRIVLLAVLVSSLTVYENIPHAPYVFLLFVIFYLSSDVCRLVVNMLYRKRNNMPQDSENNFTLGIRHIRTIFVFIAAVFSGLALFNVNIKELFTSLSIVAAAIAIISKDYISNLINGMIITFSNKLSLEDYVQIGSQKGKISDIGLINISLLSDDDDMIYIPHNTIFASEWINFTKKDQKKTSIDFEVSIDCLPTVNELEEKLIETVQVYDEHIQEGSYHLRIMNIGKDAVSLKFQYLVTKRDRELEKKIRKNTIRKVLDYIQSIKQSS